MRKGVCQRISFNAGYLLIAIGLGFVEPVQAASTERAMDSACRSSQQQREISSDLHVTVMTVLSPRMPYALKEWPRMKSVAENAGFKVIGVRDPRVPLNEWNAATHALGMHELKPMTAMDEKQAAELGLLNHSPSSLVLHCGRAHPWPVLGVMPDAAWLAVLRAREGQLKAMKCC